MDADELFMQRCIDLALLGAGHVAPNPMVGSVLVHNGSIVGEGYHRRYGEAHAEVNCVEDARRRFERRAVTEESFESFAGRCTIYVSLEPCAHFGKTPPCADLIIRMKFARVVVGCRDPFPLVDGKGIEKIRQAGIEVVTGVLEAKCRELNRRFFTFHLQKRPYIMLKWAASADGFIAASTDRRSFISNELSNRLVHRWRAEETAILIGRKTAELDNPSLNTRLWPGKNPLRLVVDLRSGLPDNLQLFTDGEPVVLFNYSRSGSEGALQYVQLNKEGSVVRQIAEAAHVLGLQSVIIEGGTFTLQQFIDEGLWDEARVIRGTTVFLEGGTRAPALSNAAFTKDEQLSSDTISYFRNKSVL
jgi:diaminohydroxyphosphoribosylaminopyrimidine deaminase/5-amino-6-(5-phosphoribosylamino)uracil reductase